MKDALKVILGMTAAVVVVGALVIQLARAADATEPAPQSYEEAIAPFKDFKPDTTAQLMAFCYEIGPLVGLIQQVDDAGSLDYAEFIAWTESDAARSCAVTGPYNVLADKTPVVTVNNRTGTPFVILRVLERDYGYGYWFDVAPARKGTGI